MAGFADLGVAGLGGLVHLAAGALLLLAPGVAAADRLVGLRRHGWLLAPVFSFTLLPLGAVALDVVFRVPIGFAATAGLAVAWTLLFAGRRVRAAVRGVLPRLGRPTLRAAVPLLLLGGVLAFVAAVHFTPHTSGGEAGAVEAYVELAGRLGDVAGGPDQPWPIHVDEHNHMAKQAAIERQGRIDIDDPYTGLPSNVPLFSVAGFRQERGFDLLVVQVHDLTGLSLPAVARFLPALQAASTASLLFLALHPAPGALASAAFVAIVPTTVHFLGPGFLVPSSFGLPWILAGLHVALRGTGSRRLAALGLLETGAFLMHLVPGVLTLAAATLGTLVRPGRAGDRAALLVACLLPLLWVGPLVAGDARDAVLGENRLPFDNAIFRAAGLPALALAGVGAALAFLPRDDHRPHRALAALAAALLAAIAASVALDHHSDATYTRLVPPVFVALAGLAGLAVGWLGRLVGAAEQHGTGGPARGTGAPSATAIAVAGLVAAIALAPAVASHLSTPYYRVFDERSWQDVRIFARSGAGPDDRFLAHPWEAPVHNAATGALPHTVMHPGTGPSQGADWEFYLQSGGASQEWFDDRGIDYVIGPGPPQAEHERLGGRVYRILHAAPS